MTLVAAGKHSDLIFQTDIMFHSSDGVRLHVSFCDEMKGGAGGKT